MSKHNYFENRGGAVYCLRDCEVIVSKHNVDELPSGNLSCLLFGSLIIVHDPHKKDNKFLTITLATRVEISIYSLDQYTIDDDDHYVITFNEGDKFLESDTVPATIKNVSELFDSLLQGNVSGLIDRDKYYDIIMNSMNLNEQLGFPRILLEIMIGEIFLDSGGKRPVRLSNTERRGKAVSIKNLVLAKNTFNGITFEDWSKALYLNKKKSFKDQEKEPSVLEEYLRK